MAAVVCGAFAPYLGWRIAYGHPTIAAGLLPFAAGFALLAAAGAGRVGAVLLVLATAATVNGLLFIGQQVVFYGAVFGAPVLAGIWLMAPRRRRALAVAAAATAGAFLVALPWFWAMLAHALSSDALRPLGGMVVTYTYLTAEARDWLTSLPWTVRSLPAAREVALHHEINHPFGSIVLLLALLPRRGRPLAVGIGASVLVTVLFSMDVRPLSTALIAALPPLGAFRVPTRAVLPVLSVLPAVALGALAARGAGEREGDRRAWWAAVVLIPALVVMLPSVARELALWAAVSALLLLRPWPPAAAAAVMAALAAGSVAGFRDRVPELPDARALLAEARAVGDAARAQQPELARPLVRALVVPEAADFSANTALAAGLASLDGYYFPTRRFVALVCALRDLPYRPSAILLRFPEHEHAGRALFQLYNQAFRVESGPEGVVTSPLIATSGPAWFASETARVANVDALARALKAPGDALHEVARRTVFLLEDDPAVAAAGLPSGPRPQCASARVVRLDAAPGAVRVRVDVDSPADCPLVLALNYVETWQAAAFGRDGRRRAATVFPANGAMTGVWTPAGTTSVELSAVVRRPPLPAAWVLAGSGLVLLAFLLARDAAPEGAARARFLQG